MERPPSVALVIPSERGRGRPPKTAAEKARSKYWRCVVQSSSGSVLLRKRGLDSTTTRRFALRVCGDHVEAGFGFVQKQRVDALERDILPGEWKVISFSEWQALAARADEVRDSGRQGQRPNAPSPRVCSTEQISPLDPNAPPSLLCATEQISPLEVKDPRYWVSLADALPLLATPDLEQQHELPALDPRALPIGTGHPPHGPRRLDRVPAHAVLHRRGCR